MIIKVTSEVKGNTVHDSMLGYRAPSSDVSLTVGLNFILAIASLVANAKLAVQAGALKGWKLPVVRDVRDITGYGLSETKCLVELADTYLPGGANYYGGFEQYNGVVAD